MGLIAIGCLLSLTLGQQRVIIMVISMILDDKNLKFQRSKITKSLSVVFHPPWESPSFWLQHTMYAISFHSNTASLLDYTKG
jgi:hypothetical protein